MSLDTKASEKVSSLLQRTQLWNDIRQLSPLHQTSNLEAFHSLLIHFVPKSTAFSYHGMLGRYISRVPDITQVLLSNFYCRLRLAALHFNENSNNLQARTKDGKARYSISFPKNKHGEHVVKKIATQSTYSKS